jgi:hypothetical protein
MGWITKGDIRTCGSCGYTSANITSLTPCPNCSNIKAIENASKRIAKAHKQSSSNQGCVAGLISLVFKMIKWVLILPVAILVLGSFIGTK